MIHPAIVSAAFMLSRLLLVTGAAAMLAAFVRRR